MEKELSIGVLVDALSTVHEVYEKAYIHNGITTENGKALMEQIFRDTWNSLKNEYISKAMFGGK